MTINDEPVPEARVATYLECNPDAKLHIGCGTNYLDGWLNTDIKPRSSEIMRLDASSRYPIQDSTFALVFSEHMIEHMCYEDGLKMLNECFRILRPGGRIRVSTPDLRFLVNLYLEERSSLQQNYCQWSAQRFVGCGKSGPAFIINNFVRNWGHLFIYDRETLEGALDDVGFVDVVSRRIRDSAVPSLRNLEREERMPNDFLQLETMTLEARKP